jgi:hypothetical protein
MRAKGISLEELDEVLAMDLGLNPIKVRIFPQDFHKTVSDQQFYPIS